MFRRALIPACLTFIAACSDGSPVEPVEPPAHPKTFVVFGFVETEDESPLAGAVVEVFALRGQVLLDSEITQADGSFAFGGIRGEVLLKASMSGYFFQTRILDVTNDYLSRFQLIPWVEAENLTLGEWIQSRVLGGESPCDPVGWDALAPCHRFLFTPSTGGRLVVTLEWNGNPALDVTLVNAAGYYVSSSVEAGFERVLLEGPVMSGQTYEVRVSSYYGPQNFRLRAELVP